MENITSFLDLKTIIAALVAAIGWVLAFTKTYQDDIKALMLRVEKEQTDIDGWTAQEKEDLVIDMFFKYAYPNLPFYIKMIPDAYLKWFIRKTVVALCEKASLFKRAPELQ